MRAVTSAGCASPSFPQAKVSPKQHDQLNTLRFLHEKTQEALSGKAEGLREALATYNWISPNWNILEWEVQNIYLLPLEIITSGNQMIWVWFINNSFFNWTALPHFVFFLLVIRNTEKSLPVSVANLSNPLCWLGDLTYINPLTYDFFIEHLFKKFWLEKPKHQGLTSGKKDSGTKLISVLKQILGVRQLKVGWVSFVVAYLLSLNGLSESESKRRSMLFMPFLKK